MASSGSVSPKSFIDRINVHHEQASHLGQKMLEMFNSINEQYHLILAVLGVPGKWLYHSN